MSLTADSVRTRSFGGCLREDDAEARAIGARMAVRRVVHLEHDVRAGLDQFSLPGLENLRRLARRVADQKIAGQRADFRLFIRADLRRREKDAGRLASEPLRFRLADERDEVMHDRPARLDALPPPESSGLR